MLSQLEDLSRGPYQNLIKNRVAFWIGLASGDCILWTMSPKTAPLTTPPPDWPYFDRGGGAEPAPAVTGSRRQPFMTVAEAAAMLRVSEKTTRRLIARGDLKAVRIGRSVRIHFSELENLIAGGGARASGSGGGGGNV